MSLSAFLNALKGLGLSKSDARNSSILHPLNLYQHCSDLPLCIFIDCLCNSNLRRLIKKGSASQKEILAAWDQIYSEYCDLSGAPGYRIYFILTKEIGFLRSKILSIKCCIQTLLIRPSEKSINQLRAYGYAYPFNFEDQEGYQKDIRMVAMKSKSVELAYELKVREFEKLKSSESELLTEQKFREIIVELENDRHIQLDVRTTTVSDFAAIRKAYTEKQEYLRKEQEKISHGRNS
jgi:hypothetical protein